MIHTLEIVQKISQVEFGVLAGGFSFTQHKIRSFLFGSKNREREHISLGRRYPGFHSLRLYRIRKNGINLYYAVIRLEPQAMISGRRTIDLFYASPDNVDSLEDAFHTVMNNFIDDSYPNLVNLSSWNCKRIDYSANLRFCSSREKDLFLELSRQTSLYIRRNAKHVRGIPESEQSTAEGNCSTKLMLYDKTKQVENTYLDIRQRDYERLHSEACNIVRFEYQCKRQKVHAIRRSRGFDSRSIRNYLSEDLAFSLLLKSYEDAIGRGDFYKVKEIDSKINDSDLRKSTKEKLKEFVRFVANTRPRSLHRARERFIEAPTAGEGQIRGTANTFNNRCRMLRELGIHPLSIPRSKHLDYLENPINQLSQPHWN